MTLKEKKQFKIKIEKDAENLYQQILVLAKNSILSAKLTYDLVNDDVNYGNILIDQLRNSKKLIYRNTDDVFIII